MKNAMKKLMSLLLVAVLLVSAIPFGASAAGTGIVVVWVNDNNLPNIENVDAYTYEQLISYAGIDTSAYNVSVNYSVNGANSALNAGGSINVSNGEVAYAYIATTAKVFNTCTTCGDQYEGASHTCPTLTCSTCGNTYTKGTSHTCPPAPQPPVSQPAVYALSIDVNNEQKVLTSGTSTSYAECLQAAGVDTTKVNVTGASYQYTTNEGVKSFNFKSGDVITFVADTRVYFFTEAKTQGSQQPTQQPTQTTGEATLQVYVNGAVKVNSKVVAGKTVNAMLAASNLDFASAWTSYYTVNSVKINGVSYNRVDITANSGDAVEVSLSRNYSKDNTHKVYLHVYLNGNAGTIAKTLDITGTYLMYDWATDVNEVKNYLSANFYNAANSNGLELDGLYISAGHFPTNYYSNNKQSAYTADVLRNDLENNHVNISVMLKNAVVKGSAAADKSNPKTGDSIYVAMTVMGVSAASLAAVMYFYNKKRMAL